MELLNIQIQGYKSIEKLNFPIESLNGSYTKILIGKNETGKSNILQAMALLNDFNNDKNVDFLKLQNKTTEQKYAEVYYTMKPETNNYRTTIKEHLDINEEILNEITVEKAISNVYVSADSDGLYNNWTFIFTPIDLSNVYFKETNGQKTKIILKSDVSEEELSQYTLLDEEKFKNLITPYLEEWFDKYSVKVSVWKPRPEYLIENEVSLTDFAVNSHKYPLLKNIFNICGYTNNEKITQKIESIGKNASLRRKLEAELSRKTTDYINKKWKEHSNISIDIRIDKGLNLVIQVKDIDVEDGFHDMEARSDGFKQFISLLLTISADNEAGHLKNKLILIDEPEIHLHPSGIRDMLQELLLLGKNNYVFVSTHSNFMLDRDTKERHYLIQIHNGITVAKQIATEEDLNDDEILQAAFGINVIRDFLSQHKLLVEGLSDKVLLKKALDSLKPKNDILITNGRGDKIKANATLMDYNEVNPLVLLDDDEAGRCFKKEVLAIGGGFNNKNVLTIRDIYGDIINKGTIEDCLPIEYVKGKMNEVLHDHNIKDIDLDDASPVCEQLKLHLQQNIPLETRQIKSEKKERQAKIDSIVKEIKSKIAEDWTARTDSPKLNALAEAICVKLGIE